MTAPTSRLLLLLSLLQTRRDWPGSLLADRLEISPRTVRRDVERLREMGYRVQAIKGPDGGYRLEAGADLPPLLFDEDQAIAVALALRTAAVSGADVQESAARALTTVRQVMPERLRARIDAIEVIAVGSPSNAGVPAVDPAVLLAVAGAARAREIVRFDYGARRDGEFPRRVEAHHVVTSSGRWYLVGWDADADDWRIFRLDRIREPRSTGRRSADRELPGGDVAAYVAARFKGSPGGDEWPCRGDVVLALPARRVRPFADDGVVEEIDEHRCRLRAGAWSWAGLAASLGRFDAEISEVHPPALAAAFDMLAERYARASGRG